MPLQASTSTEQPPWLLLMSLLLPKSPELTWTGTTPVSNNPFVLLYFPKSQGKSLSYGISSCSRLVVWHGHRGIWRVPAAHATCHHYH